MLKHPGATVKRASTLRQPALILTLLLCSVSQAFAHEYWLDPTASSWQPGDVFIADIRNGEDFVGTAYPFDDQALRFGGLISDNDRRALSGRLGDYPAIRFKLEEPGLHLALLETKPREISYDNAQAFEKFVDYHGLQDIVNTQTDQQAQEGSIRERYYRFVKTLFNVDSASSTRAEQSVFTAIKQDEASAALESQGLRYELNATRYSTESGELELVVLLDGKVVSGRQVELFYRATDKSPATRRTALSGVQGNVHFNVEAAGDYLINSVWISKPQIDDVDWETFWASLTFSH